VLVFFISLKRGENVVIYLDVIILVNYIIDFIILFFLNKMLKRNVSLFRLLSGALFGSLTIVVLFIRFNDIQLFFLKLISASLMLLLSFGYKNFYYFINNLAYLYILSIILGGSMYLLNINTLLSSVNYYALIIIISPLILKIFINYYQKTHKYKKHYSVKIIFDNNRVLDIIGFVDTGNKLRDPYFKRPIIIIDKKHYHPHDRILFVPYYTVNYQGLLKCIKPQDVYLNNIKIISVLIGFSNSSFGMLGVDCLLNEEIVEGLYV